MFVTQSHSHFAIIRKLTRFVQNVADPWF